MTIAEETGTISKEDREKLYEQAKAYGFTYEEIWRLKSSDHPFELYNHIRSENLSKMKIAAIELCYGDEAVQLIEKASNLFEAQRVLENFRKKQR